ncbi:hypothetical protein, partial [Aeromonas veronii]|uniref:hypothetical protein n=1 Tax=Aeromonas veronii TaxID=654 RepID=UPI00406CA8F7
VPPQAQSNFREQYIQQNSILLAKMDEIKDLIKDAVASGALPSLAVASFDAMLEGQMKQWGKLDKNQDNTKDFTSTMSAL